MLSVLIYQFTLFLADSWYKIDWQKMGGNRPPIINFLHPSFCQYEINCSFFLLCWLILSMQLSISATMTINILTPVTSIVCVLVSICSRPFQEEWHSKDGISIIFIVYKGFQVHWGACIHMRSICSSIYLLNSYLSLLWSHTEIPGNRTKKQYIHNSHLVGGLYLYRNVFISRWLSLTFQFHTVWTSSSTKLLMRKFSPILMTKILLI